MAADSGDAPPDFSLPNVAAGPDPLSLSALAAEVEFVVLLLQRDHYCTNCRSQVQRVAERHDAFRERGAEVVSVVPEPVERVRDWQAAYGLPFPLLADPDAGVGDSYDQPVRFGVLGNLVDFVGRMPGAVIIDARGAEPRVAWTHRGDSTWDRPDVEDLLAALDRLRDAD